MSEESKKWVQLAKKMGADSGLPELDELLFKDHPGSQDLANFLSELLISGLAAREQIKLLLNKLEIFPDYLGSVQGSLDNLSLAITKCSGGLEAAAKVTRLHLDGLIARFPIGSIDN